MDSNTCAAKSFYREVRKFAITAKPWATDAVYYDVKPDEAFDPTLISSRVYGRRDEFLAVMAAAGIDQVDEELKQRRIILPSNGRLMAIKRDTGFESIADYRDGGSPMWA